MTGNTAFTIHFGLYDYSHKWILYCIFLVAIYQVKLGFVLIGKQEQLQYSECGKKTKLNK